MSNEASVRDLLLAIRRLPADPPIEDSKAWYRTQKEHWIGWLRDYGGQGAYGRRTPSPRDARTVYNRIVEPRMLLWLLEAAGVDTALVAAAHEAAADATSMQQASGRIRQLVPWEVLAHALWGKRRRPTFRRRLLDAIRSLR